MRRNKLMVVASCAMACLSAFPHECQPSVLNTNTYDRAVGRSTEGYAEQLCCTDTLEGRRFEKLAEEIRRDFVMILSKAREEKYLSMIDLAGFIVEPFESVGTNYLPRLMALRADVEKMKPDTLRDTLLAKIDTPLTFLEKCRGRDIEGIVDLIHTKFKKADSSETQGWHPLALSIVSACGIPSGENDVYGIRLNLFGGTHHDVAGIDVGGFCNSVSNGLYGVQFAGLCNIGAYDTCGMQFAGLVNIGGWELVGMQSSGLFNLAGDVCGGQFGLFNIGSRVKGSQISGGGNIAAIVKGCQVGVGGNIALVMDGVQIAGELNSVYRLRGLQCSAIVNSGNILDGMQLSAINLSDDCRGVQIGIINKGTDVAGLQIGVLNCANTMSGCQMGLCNVIKTSAVPVLPIVNMNF